MSNPKEDDDFDIDFEDDDLETSFESDEDEEEDEEDDEDSDDPFDSVDEDEEDEDDELAGFTAEQKAKIAKRVARVEQERDEAFAFATKADAAAKRYQARATETEKLAVGEIKISAEAALKSLKEKLHDAIEAGDVEAQVDLNEKLADALLRKRSVEQAEENLKNAPPPQDDAPQPSPDEATRYKNWMAKNGDWFDPTGQNGGDVEMTAVALATHHKLVANRVKPNSPEYYAKINERMAQLYPDKFKGEKPVPKPKPKGGSAAPMSRKPGASANGKVVMKITASQRALARRLGISEKDYLREKAKYEKDAN